MIPPHIVATIAGLVMLAIGTACRAQTTALPLTELGVDLVAVKGGPRLLGAILERTPDGTVRIAIQREWLQAANVRFFEKCVQDEAVATRDSVAQLRERLDAWKKRRADDAELLLFLKQESTRVEQWLAQADPPAQRPVPQFLLLEFPKTRVERIYVQPASRKQLALVAWRERLANVENQSVSSLARNLRKQGVNDPAAQRVDLSERLPSRPQDEKEWAARMAVVEYAYRRRIDFQGTGDLVVRTDEAAPRPDLGRLAAGMFKSQLAGLLDTDANGKPKVASRKWWDAATKSAEQEQVSGFRITRVDQDLTARRVSVESRFVARMPDGSWLTVWTHAETADASKPRPDLEKRISQDPQVSQALKLAQAAGLTLGAEQLEPVLRIGAATMESQQTADDRFLEFRDRYLRRLDGPPLIVTP